RWEGLDPLARDHRDRRLELVAGLEQEIEPRGIRIIEPARIARAHEQRARRCVGGGERLGHDRLHPRVWREGLALDDADGGEWAHQLWIEGGRRLLLHDSVEHLEECPVIRRKGVHHLAAALMEYGWRRWFNTPERGLARQELGQRRADAAG